MITEQQTPKTLGNTVTPATGAVNATKLPESNRASVLDRVPGRVLDRLLARIAHLPKAHKTVPLRAPFTGETIREIPMATAEDVEQAIQRARRAQSDWAQRPFAERARVLLRFHDLVLDRQEQMLDLIQLEAGKARKHAFEEIADTAIVARYYAHHAEEHLRPRRRRGALPGLTAAWEYHHPVGVVGFIAPWNYPLTLSLTDALAALMAGNAVVLKPDQQTPFTALFGVELLEEAGLSPGLFQVVTGRGRDLGGPMIEGVDYLCFTGSTETGRSVARQAGERLLGCSLELGGKNPMLVLPDADLEAAAHGAIRGCFTGAGQLCIAIERIYVHSSVHDRFVARFAEKTRALKVGPMFDYETDMGSLVSEAQLTKVRGHVDDALKRGATAIVGGKHRPDLGPLFFEPTILANVNETMALATEETFGPVVAIYRYDSLDEAIRLSNETRYGLNASVWTRNTRLGRQVAARIKAGTVNVNEAYAAAWASVDAPMGGFKESGLGRRHGRAGILKFTDTQNVAVQRLLPLASPPGISERQYARVMTHALKVLRRIPGIR